MDVPWTEAGLVGQEPDAVEVVGPLTGAGLPYLQSVEACAVVMQVSQLAKQFVGRHRNLEVTHQEDIGASILRPGS